MNVDALTQVLRRLQPSVIRQHPLLHDSISAAALGLSVVLNFVTLGLLLAKVHQVDYPVPVHYLSLVGFDQVGSWFQTYRLAAFGFAVTIVNGLLAAQSFQRNRLVSFFLLLGAAAASLLILVISLAFAAIA
jgi:hypothetical protein